MIDEMCAEYGLEIMNIGALSWQYMRQYDLMGEHYGSLNKISREGMKAFTPDVQQKARETFEVPDDKIYGGQQFLDTFPIWNADSLGIFCDNIKPTSKKIAPSTVGFKFQHDKDIVLVFNMFLPRQLNEYHGEGQSIIVMPVRSKTAWATLRDDMVGPTNPATAPAGSFRGKLLAQKDALGIPVVDTGNNGLHLSAGPLEGMVELVRFTSNRANGSSVAYEQTNFGAAWLKAGGSAAELQMLAGNPLVNAGGKTQSAFDATELMDMNEAVAALKTALKAAA
jgi:nucleoside diphosphate kinase